MDRSIFMNAYLNFVCLVIFLCEHTLFWMNSEFNRPVCQCLQPADMQVWIELQAVSVSLSCLPTVPC